MLIEIITKASFVLPIRHIEYYRRELTSQRSLSSDLLLYNFHFFVVI